jgi:tetratricopeptide (TPR) repeat protein
LRGSETEQLTQALYEQSGGNPFFLLQLVRILEAEGSSAKLNGDLGLVGTLPGGVRDAIAKQLEGLSADTRRALSVAAGIGREFPAPVAADVLDVSMREVLALLEPAVDARLVIPGTDRAGLFRFAHMLLRDSIYEELSAVERIDLHRRIGSSLERLYADDPGPHAAELAYHFGEAMHEGGAAQAVRYAVSAGEWAAARLAYEDAAGHYRSALKILEESGPGNLLQRCELMLALGEAQMNAGQRDRARETFYQAAALAKSGAQADLLGRAALRLAPGFFTIEIGVFDALLVNLLEDAIGAVGTSDTPLRAQLLARLAMAHGWTGADERRARLTADAISVAERVGDPGALAYALSANHGLLWGPERVNERVALIDRMGSLATASRDNELILMHLLFRITSGLELGEIDQVDRDIATYVEIAESLKQPQSLWYAHSVRAAQALMRGRFEDASVHAERLFAIGGQLHDVNALNSFGIHAAIHLWEMDRTAEVLPFADQFVVKYPLIPAWQFSRAFMYFEAGHAETAKIMFDSLSQNNFARIPQNEQWSISSVLAADLCYRLEDRERSEVLYDQLAPAKSLYCVIGFGVANLGSIALRLAMLASVCEKWDLADDHFEDAIRREESIGCLPWLAHALYWYAKSTSSRGRADLKRARALCARGREVAGMVRMPKVTRKLQELSRSLEKTGGPRSGSERDER